MSVSPTNSRHLHRPVIHNVPDRTGQALVSRLVPGAKFDHLRVISRQTLEVFMIVAKRCGIVIDNLVVLSSVNAQRRFGGPNLSDCLRVLVLLTEGVDPETTTHTSEVCLQAFQCL